MNITVYNITIPETAMICSTWPSLRQAGERWPDNWLDKKYGGYVIEDNGIIVMACDDEFCAQIEEAEKKAGLFPEEYGLETTLEELGTTSGETTGEAQSFDEEGKPAKALNAEYAWYVERSLWSIDAKMNRPDKIFTQTPYL